MSGPKNFKLTIYDSENVIFEGTVTRVTSYNEVGRFDIYPMHANFISILLKELIIYNKNEKIKELQFEQAVLKVKQDIVSIFLGIEILLLENAEVKK